MKPNPEQLVADLTDQILPRLMEIFAKHKAQNLDVVSGMSMLSQIVMADMTRGDLAAYKRLASLLTASIENVLPHNLLEKIRAAYGAQNDA